MKHFDHIVFDVDGTLAGTEESALSSLVQIVQEETGKTLPRHELEFALGIPGKDALEKLGIYSQATLDRWCQVAASLKAPSACFQVCLKSSQHSPIAAANLASSPHVRATNTQKKLHPLVSISILSTSSLSKTQPNINPHPHPCSNISDVRARNPGNVVYVGDTVYDEQCATSAGVSFARAAWGSHQDIPNATYNLKTPNDLLILTTK